MVQMSSGIHERAHDVIADEESFSGQHQMVAVAAQQSVGNETLSLMQTVVAILIRQRIEVKAIAGTQGHRNAVIVMRVGIDDFTFTGNFTPLDSIHILAEVGDVPRTDSVGVGGKTAENSIRVSSGT